MDSKILTEPLIAELPDSLDWDKSIIFFKLVGIAPKHYSAFKEQPKDLVSKQPDFYIYSLKDNLRETLHFYVDKFCDAQGVK